jgi:hypothetical protein
VGRRDVLMEAPRVVLRWGDLLPEALRMVRRVGLMEALRVGLIVVWGEIEQGAHSVGRNAFQGGRVEGLLSCS